MTWIVGGLALVLIFGALAWGCAAITPSGRAVDAAEAVGVTDAHVVSRGIGGIFGGCSEDDTASFQVEGVRNGRPVRVKVCGRILGGYTVRS